MIDFIIKGFWTIVFIFIVISTTSSSLLQVFVELRETTWNFELCPLLNPVSDSICHNRVQVLSIPILLLTCSQD